MRLLPSSADAVLEALDVLKNGGVIAHATETCYGLACDLKNPTAVKKLFAIKKRSTTQPVSALFKNVEQAKDYTEWTTRADELAALHLPGPLTLILRMRTDAPAKLYPIPDGTAESLGIRVSSNPLASQLATFFGGPISTTSANVHGEENPYDAQSIFQRFSKEKQQPDLILDSGTLPKVPPSTVMDLVNEGEIRRKGTI